MHWWKSAVGDTHVTLNCTWQHLCCIAHWRSANLTLNTADCTIVRCKLDIPKCTAQLAAHCTCYIALCTRIWSWSPTQAHLETTNPPQHPVTCMTHATVHIILLNCFASFFPDYFNCVTPSRTAVGSSFSYLFFDTRQLH